MNNDEYFMNKAILEAKIAASKNEVPVGCVIVKDNKIIAKSHNTRHNDKGVLSHAEISCIKKASKKLNSWILEDCDIYITLEPCLMCSGMILQSRIRRVIFGANEPKHGACGSIINVFDHNVYKFNHKVEVTKNILNDECSKILSDFFKKLRIEKKNIAN